MSDGDLDALRAQRMSQMQSQFVSKVFWYDPNRLDSSREFYK